MNKFPNAFIAAFGQWQLIFLCLPLTLVNVRKVDKKVEKCGKVSLTLLAEWLW